MSRSAKVRRIHNPSKPHDKGAYKREVGKWEWKTQTHSTAIEFTSRSISSAAFDHPKFRSFNTWHLSRFNMGFTDNTMPDGTVTTDVYSFKSIVGTIYHYTPSNIQALILNERYTHYSNATNRHLWDYQADASDAGATVFILSDTRNPDADANHKYVAETMSNLMTDARNTRKRPWNRIAAIRDLRNAYAGYLKFCSTFGLFPRDTVANVYNEAVAHTKSPEFAGVMARSALEGFMFDDLDMEGISHGV